MDQFEAGDVIEHRLMPGYTMKVLGTKDCETDGNRPEPHLAYQVTDPEGNPDWLCAHDVQKPGEGLPWGGGGGPRGASYSNGPLEPRSLRDLPRTETIFNLMEPRAYQ